MGTTETSAPEITDRRDLLPRFTMDDAQRAYDEWGANCGPGAIAAICGLTLDEVRPHLGDFEQKRYTNPTLMCDTLRRLGFTWTPVVRTKTPRPIIKWPTLGVVRIQWEGPWTKPGVPMRARYRYTHWIGAATVYGSIGIFDINCMNNGHGWVSLADWERVVVPAIVADYPRADGKWHQTHVLDYVKRACP